MWPRSALLFQQEHLCFYFFHVSSFTKQFAKCHLICSPLTALRSKCAHPHCKDEATVSARLNPLPKVMQIEAAKQEFQPQLQNRMPTLFPKKGR